MALRALPRLLLATTAMTVVVWSGPSAVSAEAEHPWTVLAIYWSSESFPGTPELDATIQKALLSRSDRIDYFAEYLESDRFPDEEASVALRDYIQRKYQRG